MAETVLLVDDEPDVVNLLRFNLKKAGMQVTTAADGLSALKLARRERPDVIILDLMLPEMDGTTVCRELRRDNETISIPILMLTARAQEEERVQGLETGADDYVTKPFSPKEVVLRVKKLVERSRKSAGSRVLKIGPFYLDRDNFKFRIDGESIDLTSTEFKLLNLMIERRGRTQSRETLLQDVWGYRQTVDSRTVDTHMRRLREKLGKYAGFIQTIRGEGYRMIIERQP